MKTEGLQDRDRQRQRQRQRQRWRQRETEMETEMEMEMEMEMETEKEREKESMSYPAEKQRGDEIVRKRSTEWPHKGRFSRLWPCSLSNTLSTPCIY